MNYHFWDRLAPKIVLATELGMRGQKLVVTGMLPVTATVLIMVQDWQHKANRINKA
jgi:hypothetical protein